MIPTMDNVPTLRHLSTNDTYTFHNVASRGVMAYLGARFATVASVLSRALLVKLLEDTVKRHKHVE